MDGKNVVNIIYNNIYISPNNVSQNWLTLIMLLHSYIIYTGLVSTLFPLPFPFKQTFPLLPMQKRKKGVARLPIEILFRNLRSPLVAWLEKLYETTLINTEMQALYVSEICVACWGMQSPPNATITSAARFVAKLFLSQLICFFSPFSAPRNYHIAIS